jgi:hypothetical protein
MVFGPTAPTSTYTKLSDNSHGAESPLDGGGYSSTKMSPQLPVRSSKTQKLFINIQRRPARHAIDQSNLTIPPCISTSKMRHDTIQFVWLGSACSRRKTSLNKNAKDVSGTVNGRLPSPLCLSRLKSSYIVLWYSEASTSTAYQMILFKMP